MKAITLTQPWATLIAIGAKRIETRGWPTQYRGPLLIHAAKGLASIGGAEGLLAICQQPPFSDALRERYEGKTYGQALPFGAAVAVCRLSDCVPTDPGMFEDEPLVMVHQTAHARERERAFGDYSPGRYGFVLDDVVPLPQPIACKGALGLWAPPEHVIAYAVGAIDATVLL